MRDVARLFAVLCLLLSACCLPARAQAPVFAEEGINIFVVSEPKGAARHGYAEYIFEIRNVTSSHRRVTLTMPAEDYGGDSVLTSLSRRTEIEPNSSVLLSIYQPALPLISGQNVRV